MIGYVLNAPISILLREKINELKRPEIWCEMCLRDGKCVPATDIFYIKSCRYYAVCDDCYQFLKLTGGIKEKREMGADWRSERKEDDI